MRGLKYGTGAQYLCECTFAGRIRHKPLPLLAHLLVHQRFDSANFVSMKAAKRPITVTTFLVQAAEDGRFEVRDDLLVLGTSQNEMMAVWSAVELAENMSKSGCKARVIRRVEGDEVEEWPGLP